MIVSLPTKNSAQDCLEIGVGLEGPAYWSLGDRPFVDQLKFSADFHAYYDGNWDNQVMDLIPVDPDGYPNAGIPYTADVPDVGEKSLKCKKVISSSGRVKIGNYVFLYDGVGTFSFPGFNATKFEEGRIELTCTSTGNVWLEMNQSDASPNHARNFRLIPVENEDTYETDVFYAPFIEKLSNFSHVRFMDWFRTNNSPTKQWEDRTSPSYNSKMKKSGVDYESAITLCNQTNITPWVNVPHQADDNYIEQMAILFRDGLNDDLDIYVEYSNEVWNWQFHQTHWINGETSYGINPLFDATKSYAYNGGIHAKRNFKIWREVFGADSLRVKRVLAGQAAFSWIASENIEATNGQFDFLSPACYFGANPQDNFTAETTAEEVIESAREEFFVEYFQNFSKHYELANALGKKVIHYEAGQHITAFGNQNYIAQQAFYDAQYSPLMYDLYDDVLDSIRNWGSVLTMQFQLAGAQESIYGSWGHIGSVDITPSIEETPKFMALIDNLPSDENCITAIKDIYIQESNDISISPNPTSGIVRIQSLSNQKIESILMYSHTGHVVLNRTYPQGGIVDISTVPKGIYIIEIKYGNNIERSKLIVL